jgi:hypothetical protein
MNSREPSRQEKSLCRGVRLAEGCFVMLFWLAESQAQKAFGPPIQLQNWYRKENCTVFGELITMLVPPLPGMPKVLSE